MTDQTPPVQSQSKQGKEQGAGVCFDNGGRVFVRAIPHDRAADAPPMGCVGCRERLYGGDGFFVEIDSGRGWGVGCMVICGSCMAESLRTRNVITAAESLITDRPAKQGEGRA